ncbi:MAG: hemolysin family protein [Chitinophagales bacterium]|nr:hemolysin family protein [Chitinophagales bacterium]
MALFIFIVMIILLVMVVISAIEEAYLSTNKLSIEVFKNKGSRRGQILTDLYESPRTFLNAILTGGVVLLVLITLLVISPWSMQIMQMPIGQMVLTFAAIAIGLMLIVSIAGQYIPRLIAKNHANELVFRLAPVLRFIYWIFVIPAWIITGISGFIGRLLFGKQHIEDVYNITRTDLEDYLQTNVNEEQEIDKEILTNALHLSHIKVRDCMIPRNEVVFVDKTDDIDDVKSVFISSRHSRLIVVDGDLENVVGYIHHQQLFKNITSLKRNILDIKFVPDVMNLQDLMYRFIRNGTNIACVVDEYGSMAGIITLEDILEEIFGDIADEHDEEDYKEEQISESEYIFSGRLELSYLNSKYDQLNFPEDYITLSGYIVMTSGAIPEVGEKITLDNYTFEVLERSDTKIEEVKVIVLSTSQDDMKKN